MVPEASSRSLLSTLDAEHPEWRPLLAVIETALREARRPQWTRFVPAPRHPGSAGRPLLDGAVLTVAPKLVGRWVRQILTVARRAGTEVQPLISAVAMRRIDPLFLFETAVSRDVHRLDELARVTRDDRGVLRGLAPLIARPILQACRRAWADRVPAGWGHAYCPICGGAAALAEIRGLDGRRHLRCACCGGDWRIEWLRCPFCGEADHDMLGSLVAPDSLEHTIEVCDSCLGYVKSITTLTPIRAEHVVLQDLATLVLDVAAIERGYRRPAAAGPQVAVRVAARRSWLGTLFGVRP